jgi:hypothetical protein
MKALLIVVALCIVSCVTIKPKLMTLKVIYQKNGYTYASSSYRTYRAKLDTVLPRGTIITVVPCSDTSNLKLFRRIN